MSALTAGWFSQRAFRMSSGGTSKGWWSTSSLRHGVVATENCALRKFYLRPDTICQSVDYQRHSRGIRPGSKSSMKPGAFAGWNYEGSDQLPSPVEPKALSQ